MKFKALRIMREGNLHGQKIQIHYSYINKLDPFGDQDRFSDFFLFF